MTRAEWASTTNPGAMLAFAALRIPRNHLSLVLASIVEWIWVRWHPAHPNDWRLAWMVACVRGECFFESVKRYSDGDNSPAYRAAQRAYAVAHWPTSTIAHPLTYGFESDEIRYATAASDVARDALAFAATLELDARAAEAELASLIRAQVPWPERVSRDWRPRAGLVVAGDAMLRIQGWLVADAIATADFATLAPDRAIALDAALTSETETEEQAQHRAFLERLDAQESARRAPPSPPAPRLGRVPALAHPTLPPAPPPPKSEAAPFPPPPPIAPGARWFTAAGTSAISGVAFVSVLIGGISGENVLWGGVFALAAGHTALSVLRDREVPRSKAVAADFPLASVIAMLALSFLVGAVLTAPLGLLFPFGSRLAGYEPDRDRALARNWKALQRIEKSQRSPAPRADEESQEQRARRLARTHAATLASRAKITARRPLPTELEAVFAALALAPYAAFAAWSHAPRGQRADDRRNPAR